MRLPLILRLLCGALLVSVEAAAASLPAPPAPAGVVVPGAVVETRVPRLPGDVEEFELLLVSDVAPPIRVCAEQPAGTSVVRWRVPTLATGSARLVLRAGGEHEERESAPSAVFTLAPVPASELARVLAGRSEAGHRFWAWAGRTPPAGIGRPSNGSLDEASGLAPEGEPANGPFAWAPAAARPHPAPAVAVVPAAPALVGHSRLLMYYPLRN